jgi:hypothetical protein
MNDAEIYPESCAAVHGQNTKIEGNGNNGAE